MFADPHNSAHETRCVHSGWLSVQFNITSESTLYVIVVTVRSNKITHKMNSIDSSAVPMCKEGHAVA
jgi:hypothetical protein